MDKKKGFAIIIFLVLILGTIDAAWIIFIKRGITTNVIGGGEKTYTFLQDFDDEFSIDTSGGPAGKNTTMVIADLEEDVNMLFEIETRVINLSSSCPDYKEDCRVVVTQIHYNGTRNILSDTDHYNIEEDANLTLFKDIDNILEYNVMCAENSCPQRIISNITLSEI